MSPISYFAMKRKLFYISTRTQQQNKNTEVVPVLVSVYRQGSELAV